MFFKGINIKKEKKNRLDKYFRKYVVRFFKIEFKNEVYIY